MDLVFYENSLITRAFIQSLVMKKTFEAVSFDYRRYEKLKGIRRELVVTEACEETARLVELYGMEMLSGKRQKKKQKLSLNQLKEFAKYMLV